jgi:hypothetical protein
MMKLLYEGGPIFTYPMTLILMINLVLIARNFAYLFGGKFNNQQEALRWINPVRYIAIFILTAGILGQIIGLYSAFAAIEAKVVEITPELLAGGIRVSSITTLLGLSYFLICYASWFILKVRAGKLA